MISKEQTVKALKVVMDINRDETPCNAMFNYSGHVESISISLYPYGFNKDSDRWYSFTFHTISGEDEGYSSVWDGVSLRLEEELKFSTLDEMLTVIKGIAMGEMKDGQTE